MIKYEQNKVGKNAAQNRHYPALRMRSNQVAGWLKSHPESLAITATPHPRKLLERIERILYTCSLIVARTFTAGGKDQEGGRMGET